MLLALSFLKDEVFYLQSGKMLVKYSDGDDIEEANELILEPISCLSRSPSQDDCPGGLRVV